MHVMSFAKAFFDARTIQRARKLFDRGEVTILEGTTSSVLASVHDDGFHEVRLRRRLGGIRAFCSCPDFSRNGLYCGHIAAACVAADRYGYLRDARDVGEPIDDVESADEHPALRQADTGSRDAGALPAELQKLLAEYSEMMASGSPPGSRSIVTATPKPVPRPLSWAEKLDRILCAPAPDPQRSPLKPAWQVLYVVDVATSVHTANLTIELAARGPRRAGGWTKPRALSMPAGTLGDALADPDDRIIVSALVGGAILDRYAYRPAASQYAPGAALLQTLLPAMARTGRLFARAGGGGKLTGPLQIDDGPPWELALEVVRDQAGTAYHLSMSLRRGVETAEARSASVVGSGWLIVDDRLARLEHGDSAKMLGELVDADVRVPLDQGPDMVGCLLASPVLPKLVLPEELRVDEVKVEPAPYVRIDKPARSLATDRLQAELSFDYEKERVPAAQSVCAVLLAGRRMARRDLAAEAAYTARLAALGFTICAPEPGSLRSGACELAPGRLPDAVRALTREGWRVEADGKLYRRPVAFKIEVKSGIDWFDLEASAEYGGVSASLPALLAALRKGNDTVVLDDGTIGMLPEEWLGRWGFVAGLGRTEDDAIRFERSQASLLDALLAASPETSCDEVFRRARDELSTFERILPADAPRGFAGELRAYQREGLGWIGFLERFGFGGCLADDMGLGKTVQALAALERRREARESAPAGDPARPGPSIVVAPRSLVFNWKAEAARFAPKIRVLDYAGVARAGRAAETESYDLLLTTYGTLRRDAATLKDIRFDYVILDEAQAIKNAATDSSKAARLLQSQHRLALSGTPIENHLGELWSLFEFLNPGMLGRSSTFTELTSERPAAGASGTAPDTGTDGRRVLARALRPFMLRRTKEQVATDLPAKTEQTVYCELDAPQRKLYDQLRDHYRSALMGRIERDGLGTSKILVIEALLRLRQAACHPGLVDPARAAEPCAKLDALLPQLADVVEEGSKALVFSQFTSLLAILRRRLDASGFSYEYLDGRTRDRSACVEHFQTDPDCRVFLISLKAGGLGLNLTAAEYVFLLDPWWNPAVEAQAVDRVHRIGQTKACFAYRLIARDTVEEKVLELQRSKRELADAIVNADGGLIHDLTREDLELLLA